VQKELSGQVVGDGMMMRFTVAGPTLKVEGVRFEEPIAAQNKIIAAEAQELVGKPFSRFTIELFLQEHVRPVYWERGHLRVKFPAPQARFTGDPRKPLADSVLVLIPVEPGAIYRWAGVTWTGNAAFGPAALDSFVQIPGGLPVNGNKVQETWQGIEHEYGRRGYIAMKLAAEPAFDETNLRVRYTVRIDEGLAYRMGELIITGLSPLASRKLSEAWAIEKGAVFDRIYLDNFLAACESKRIFGDYVVHYDTVGHLLQTHPETRTVDLMIDFK
jgi:outer membrane protein assembly factor BamA